MGDVVWEPGMKLTFVDEHGTKYDHVPKGYRMDGPRPVLATLGTGECIILDPNRVLIYSPAGWEKHQKELAEQEKERERLRKESHARTHIHLFDKTWKVGKCIHGNTGWVGFEIDMTKMCEPPDLNFKYLESLSEHFGTQDIDVDHIAESGCETCDYGSSYGYKIQVYNATKNVWTPQEETT